MRNRILDCTVLFVMISAIFGFAGAAEPAPVINATGASGSGTYNNSPGLLIDHASTLEGQSWKSATGVWWGGLTPYFTIDLGRPYTLEDIVLSVDNNDSYRVDYSTDSSAWNQLLTVATNHGEVRWGMDTMATASGHAEYVADIDFTPVNARYLRMYATTGDNMYAVSEVEAYGNAVPIPGAICLLGSGMAGLIALRRKRSR